jgi:hypothetical protein
VHQGVSLEAFLHAYRAALFGYWDACAEEASRLDISRAAGLALARFALDAIDTVTTHAAEASLREETRVRTQSGREARDLIERLIRGQPIADHRRHPAAPGLDPTGPLVTIVGRIDETTLPVGDALQVARDALEEDMSLGKVRPLMATRQGEIVLVAAGSSSLDKRASLRTPRQRTLDERRGADRRPGTSPLGQRARPSPRMAASTVPTRGAMARARRERLARGSHPLSRGGLIDAGDQGVMRTATSYFVTEERCPGVSPAGIAFSVSSPCL